MRQDVRTDGVMAAAHVLNEAEGGIDCGFGALVQEVSEKCSHTWGYSFNRFQVAESDGNTRGYDGFFKR